MLKYDLWTIDVDLLYWYLYESYNIHSEREHKAKTWTFEKNPVAKNLHTCMFASKILTEKVLTAVHWLSLVYNASLKLSIAVRN